MASMMDEMQKTLARRRAKVKFEILARVIFGFCDGDCVKIVYVCVVLERN